jgi:hypothetical protein
MGITSGISEYRYNAEISAGSLMLWESRIIAGLLLDGADERQWQKAISVDNILQKKVPSTARRMARLIRNRLELVTPDLWELVINGTSEVALQSLLVAAIKHSQMLGDFLFEVVKDHFRVFEKQLTIKDWNHFLAVCEQRDSVVSTWSDTTRAKLGQVVFRILAESKYIDSTRSLQITPVAIIPEVLDYLSRHQESYVIKCMDIFHG